MAFDELPQVHDPASGWLQSCNTAANFVTEGHTLKAEDFPPGAVCGHYAPDGRIWRGPIHRSQLKPAGTGGVSAGLPVSCLFQR